MTTKLVDKCLNSKKKREMMSRFTRFTLVKRKSKAIGLKISTKTVNEMAREDITATYKYPGGSKLERLSFERAYAHGARPKYQNGQKYELQYFV